MEKTQKITWAENAKAIAMYLVVLGHFKFLSAPFENVIYAFHLPLFLFMTGFLLSARFVLADLRGVFAKHIGPYLRAYVFFALVSSVLWYVLFAGQRTLVVAGSLLLGIVTGAKGWDDYMIHNNHPLWYFPFLITSLIVVYGVLKLPPLFRWIAVMAYCLVSLNIFYPRMPWCMDIAGIGVFFIVSGYEIRTRFGNLNTVLQKKFWIILAPVLFVVLLWGVQANGHTNINKAEFGISNLLYLANAMAGIALILVLARALPVTRLAGLISKHTLVIFCTHIYVVKVFNKFPYPTGDLMQTMTSALYALVVLGVCLALSLVVDPVLKRYVLRK